MNFFLLQNNYFFTKENLKGKYLSKHSQETVHYHGECDKGGLLQDSQELIGAVSSDLIVCCASAVASSKGDRVFHVSGKTVAAQQAILSPEYIHSK